MKELLETVQNKEKDWKTKVKNAEAKFGEDIIDTLGIIGRSKGTTSQNYQDAVKLINARITNLESNLHIEIDMERIEDRSKALSYIGIEVADALKVIPTPVDYDKEDLAEEQNVEAKEVAENSNVAAAQETQEDSFINDTRMEVKPSLWQRIKNSKFGRAVSYILRIKVVLDVPALPEGRGE